MFDTIRAVEKYRDLIFKTEETIRRHPETGYKEVKTDAYMKDLFASLGYEITAAGDITGFYTVLDTGRPGPTLMILAELDALLCAANPNADPVTGAAHACGHHAQCAAMAGIAGALREPGALEGLSGRIKLCVVPAEELLEITYRDALVRQGTIGFLGGKTEFMRRGYFDDVDLAFMIHTGGGKTYAINKGSVGCLLKRVVYKGKAAHAGGAPWMGHNALYAATCGINAVNALRETFRESDCIRFHPIITAGGQAVNAIPDRVEIETYVRGKTFDAILAANRRIDRALIGAALSLDCNVEIIDRPGYGPLYNDEGLSEALAQACARVIPQRGFTVSETFGTGSTDMGDLCCVMPVIHPHTCGAQGAGHGADYVVADVEAACVDSAKAQVELARILLGEGARRAAEIVKNYVPAFPSIKEYLAFAAGLFREGDRIGAEQEGTLTVRL